MLQQVTLNMSVRKLNLYHVYFDNLFCCPDLLIHLKKGGLRPTSTVKANRVKEENFIPKDAPRGTYALKHDKDSGLNFITLKDSKVVNILSTATGVTPETLVKRYSKEEKKKVDIPFTKVVSVYNQFMGGIDLHDMYCNRVMPIIRSKKWTWIIFIRIIQSSITNTTVLWNTACATDDKLAIKDVAMSIAKKYLISKSEKSKKHVMTRTNSDKCCS